MKSSSKIFGVILSGCLMLAASGCVVMDPADEAAAVEAEWADELFEDAVEDEARLQEAELEQRGAAGGQGYEIMEGEPAPQDLPDPFKKPQPSTGTPEG